MSAIDFLLKFGVEIEKLGLNEIKWATDVLPKLTEEDMAILFDGISDDPITD